MEVAGKAHQFKGIQLQSSFITLRKSPANAFQRASASPINVCFGLNERGMARQEQLDIAQSFIKKVGLIGFKNHYVALKAELTEQVRTEVLAAQAAIV